MRNLNDRFCGGIVGSVHHDGMFIGLGLAVYFGFKVGMRVVQELMWLSRMGKEIYLCVCVVKLWDYFASYFMMYYYIFKIACLAIIHIANIIIQKLWNKY